MLGQPYKGPIPSHRPLWEAEEDEAHLPIPHFPRVSGPHLLHLAARRKAPAWVGMRKGLIPLAHSAQHSTAQQESLQEASRPTLSAQRAHMPCPFQEVAGEQQVSKALRDTVGKPSLCHLSHRTVRAGAPHPCPSPWPPAALHTGVSPNQALTGPECRNVTGSQAAALPTRHFSPQTASGQPETLPQSCPRQKDVCELCFLETSLLELRVGNERGSGPWEGPVQEGEESGRR